MRGAFFKDNFWSLDITSNIGYDCLLQHMNDGRKNCKEFEDFLKERAAIEERYGKDLLTLTKKKPCGQTEINTLKRALDIFKQQIDNVGQCHIQLAQALRDEARRMEDFREKQKAERKKIEAAMDVMHKQKQMQYKKTMDSKKTYEQKCREKEDAEQNVARCNKNTMNQKQQDKIYAKLAHSKVTLEDADKTYQQNVNLLDKIREDWQSEHIMACVFFEKQEWDRINYYRNAVWTHVNQLSQQCVVSDGIHEEVRKGLESCNIERDIECFTEGHRTGDKAPAPIPYENFYSNQRNSAPVTRRPPPQTPISIPDDPAYASLDDYRL
ncbi:proline-serine-threonine phosphatase-interacting protein 2 isoform X1 [Rana temporaria]|uniref:proline-serine-threonine phosphatase-interacting protein 2 isoform X1 n=1 Tax=Rana temporaria TaxID=8407 RepID=UPI001AAD5476|nr:proline-serine-threonine phosphatase-interacting protein 2 isoform X1 [Rana temporaria]